MQVIIYKNEEGGISVLHPIQEVLDLYGIEAIAKKDVPYNRPYKIIDLLELPLDGTINEFGVPNIDRSFRDDWDVDSLDLTDGVGGESNEFN